MATASDVSITYTPISGRNVINPVVESGDTASFLASGNYLSSVQTLTIVAPRPNSELNAWSIYNRWVPGHKWHVPVGAYGGSFPYIWKLVNAPSGMTINGNFTFNAAGGYDYGTIEWPSPTAGTHNFTLVCVDQEGSIASVDVSLTIDASTDTNFVWVNGTGGTLDGGAMAAGNDSTGDGSYATPFATINGWYKDNYSDTTFQGKTVVYRGAATYMAEQSTDNLIDLTAASYQWTASGATGEFYCEAVGTGEPSNVPKPDKVYFNSSPLTAGTIGSLSAGQYAWGDNDSLGYDTIYVRLSGDVDPDSGTLEAGRNLKMGANKPLSHIGYPGEAATVDLSFCQWVFSDGSVDDTQLINLAFSGHNPGYDNAHQIFFSVSSAARVLIWGCDFSGHTTGGRMENDNPDSVYKSDGGAWSDYWLVKDCSCTGIDRRDNLNNGGFLKIMTARKFVFEDIRVLSVGASPPNALIHCKHEHDEGVIRLLDVAGDTLSCPQAVVRFSISDSGALTASGAIEMEFSSIVGSTSSGALLSFGIATANHAPDTIYIRRCSFAGYSFAQYDNYPLTINLESCAVSADADSGWPTWSQVNHTIVDAGGHVEGNAATGIIDRTDGALTASYSSSVGTVGWEIA